LDLRSPWRASLTLVGDGEGDGVRICLTTGGIGPALSVGGAAGKRGVVITVYDLTWKRRVVVCGNLMPPGGHDDETSGQFDSGRAQGAGNLAWVVTRATPEW